MRIVCNGFVLRQTRTSQFSHWEKAPHMQAGMTALEALAMEHFGNAEVTNAKAGSPPPKGPIWSIPVPARGFYCPITALVVGGAPDRISASYAARREDEDACLQVTSKGAKTRAKHVSLIVYSRAALGDDATSKDADGEIVSINARVTERPEPMNPFTMARNALGLAGGTYAAYTADEFARATVFWAQHALVTPGDHHENYGYEY